MYEWRLMIPMCDSHVKLGISSPIWSGLAPVPACCCPTLLLFWLPSSDIARRVNAPKPTSKKRPRDRW